MGQVQVRYNCRVVNYDRRGFIRLATEDTTNQHQTLQVLQITFTILIIIPKNVL